MNKKYFRDNIVNNIKIIITQKHDRTYWNDKKKKKTRRRHLTIVTNSTQKTTENSRKLFLTYF